MNERIRDIEAYCWENTSPEWAENCRMTFNIEKFAELILNECIETIRLVPYKSETIEFGEEVVYQESIKKHFGIKE